MTKLLPLEGINVTSRISNDKEIRTKGGYELALIPTTELTSRDWNDILQSIQELVAVDIKQYEEAGPLGTQVKHQKLLQDCAEIKGWRSIPGSILLALEATNGGNKEPLESEFRRGLQINLFNNLPMSMPSVVNENLRHAAMERARLQIDDKAKPILTFIENTQTRKRPDSLTLADSGMVTGQETILDETIIATQPEPSVQQEEILPEPVFPMIVEQRLPQPRPKTPANTDNEDEEGGMDSSHVFISDGQDDHTSEKSDDTITALRNEVTILRNENQQANFRIRNQERLIEDITQASEEQNTHLEKELLDKTQAVYSLQKERRNDETNHIVAIDQLQSQINQLKGENTGLNELIKRVHGHERNVDRVQNQLNHRIASIASGETSHQNHERQVAQVGNYRFTVGGPSINTSAEKHYIPSCFSTLPPHEERELPVAPAGRLIMPRNQNPVREDDYPIAYRPSEPLGLGQGETAMEDPAIPAEFDLCTPSRPLVIPDQSRKPTRLRSRRLTREFLEEDPLENISPIRHFASTRRNENAAYPKYEEQKQLFSHEKPKTLPAKSKIENPMGIQNRNSDLRLYVNDREVQKSTNPPKVKTGKEAAKSNNPATLASLNQFDGVDDDEDYDGRRIRQRVRIFQPKDFGLTQWKPTEMDITTHLDIVAKCVEEARSLGATEANLVRLLMRTMPENYKFLSEFIGPEKRTNYETFAAEVTRVLSERAPVQMASFLQANRKAGEHLLSYFYRIATLYKSSNGLTGNKWQEDSTHVIALLAKIYDCLYEDARAELTRRLEPHIEQNTLTIDKLKGHLVEVSKLGSMKKRIAGEKISITALETGNGKVVNDDSHYKNNRDEKNNTDDQDRNEEDRRPKCWFCDKPGHFRADCMLWRKSIGQREQREGRENKDPRDGRHGSANQSRTNQYGSNGYNRSFGKQINQPRKEKRVSFVGQNKNRN